MTRLLILTVLMIYSTVAAQTGRFAKVRLDGLYQTASEIDEDQDTTRGYLRFYADGRVISVTSEGTAWEIWKWFQYDAPSVSKGTYKIKKDKIYFSTTSNEGTVIYRGKTRDNNSLIFRTKSLINGHRGKEKYYFEQIPDL